MLERIQRKWVTVFFLFFAVVYYHLDENFFSGRESRRILSGEFDEAWEVIPWRPWPEFGRKGVWKLENGQIKQTDTQDIIEINSETQFFGHNDVGYLFWSMKSYAGFFWRNQELRLSVNTVNRGGVSKKLTLEFASPEDRRNKAYKRIALAVFLEGNKKPIVQLGSGAFATVYRAFGG